MYISLEIITTCLHQNHINSNSLDWYVITVKEAEDDARVSKLISQNYDNQPSGKLVIPFVSVVLFIHSFMFLRSFNNEVTNVIFCMF